MIYTEFLIISFFSIICCFLLIFFARKFDLIDYPTKRKKHKFLYFTKTYFNTYIIKNDQLKSSVFKTEKIIKYNVS